MRTKIAIVAFFLLSLPVMANEFEISLNNDVFFSTDRHYTHGTYLAYTHEIKEPYEHWWFKKDINARRYSLGQYMYTPSDIEIEELMEEDRPYGGLLYIETCDYMESSEGKRLQSLSLLLGVVGPSSGSGNTQKIIHQLIDSAEPLGWDHQLNDEPVIDVIYCDRYRFLKKDYAHFIGYGGIAAGNLNTHLNTGCTLKLGWNVPSDFDVTRLEPLPRKWKDSFSIYGFANLEGRAVLHNIFLDGNTFSSSHSVEKEIFVGDLVAGLAVSLYNIDIAYSFTYRTKEFVGQEDENKFGAINISYRW